MIFKYVFVFECEIFKFKGSYLYSYRSLIVSLDPLNYVGFTANTLFITFLVHVAIPIQTFLTATVLPDDYVLIQISQSIHDISIVTSWHTYSFDPFQLLATTVTFLLVLHHRVFALLRTFLALKIQARAS